MAWGGRIGRDRDRNRESNRETKTNRQRYAKERKSIWGQLVSNWILTPFQRERERVTEGGREDRERQRQKQRE